VACCVVGQMFFFKVVIEKGKDGAVASLSGTIKAIKAPPTYKGRIMPPEPASATQAEKATTFNNFVTTKVSIATDAIVPQHIGVVMDKAHADLNQAFSRGGLAEELKEFAATRRLLGSKLHQAEEGTKMKGSGDSYTLETHSVVSFCKDLWNGDQYVLSLSIIVFTLLWPIIHVILVLVIWVCNLNSDIRQGVALALVFLAKWALLGHFFMTVWIPSLKMALPGGGMAHLEAEWGCALFTGGILLAYGTIGFIGTFERTPRQDTAYKPKVDSAQSIPFHAVFFTLTAITTILLVAALCLPAYHSQVSVTFQENGVEKTSTMAKSFTVITAGTDLIHEGIWSKVLGGVYIALVTTLPGMFIVSAVVAWVTSPLERAADDDTNFAMAVCNQCGRLVSLDVWLYAFGITYFRLDDLQAFISTGEEYKVSLELTPRIGVFASAGCIFGMWLMHTLAQFAHQRDSDSWDAVDQAAFEPVFSPPIDIPETKP